MSDLVPTYTAEFVGGPSLTEQMEYAKALSAGTILPDAYRGKPANILIAIGLGQAMGLSPAESLWRIDVIGGKPSAAAELIAANVRKAGHKLRVKVIEDPPSATCTIVRSDDPEPTVVTRDMAWAQRMGLTVKDNYKKQPATMLSWRAISACARLACPEALYGVAYTPDEMADVQPVRVVEEPPSGADRMRAALGQDKAPPIPEDDGAEYGQPTPLDTSGRLAKAMFAALNGLGITTRDARLTYVSDVLGRTVESSAELTEDDARTVLTRADVDKADHEAMDKPHHSSNAPEVEA